MAMRDQIAKLIKEKEALEKRVEILYMENDLFRKKKCLPSFTLQQALDIFDKGAGMLIYQPDFKEVKKTYFKQTFNIDIP